MTKKEIDELNELEFTEILKACLLRLQDTNKTVVEVKHDSYNGSSIIFPYVDYDESHYIRLDYKYRDTRLICRTSKIDMTLK